MEERRSARGLAVDGKRNNDYELTENTFDN